MQQQARRASALKHLRLKTVIKESHCSPVQQLAFNTGDAGASRNLFATVGRDQATIYDDEHMGDFVAVVASLALSTTPAEAKDAFCAAAWVACSGLTRHPYGDALLAVGGADRHIHIISAAEAAVVAQLPVPAGTSVAELSAAADCPGLLLALCRDGSMQLWQVGSGRCLWSVGACDAHAVALHPSGACIVSSSRSGKLSTWDLQLQQLAPVAADAAAAKAASCSSEVVKQPLVLDVPPENAVDCLRFLSGDRLAFKAVDGRMAVIDWPSGKQLSSWRVPGFSSAASSSSSFSSRCSFGHTADGQIICVGNPNAAAYVYSAATGSQLARVEAIRVQGPVRACGLSEDCRHLAIVVGAGYVFRFESSMAAASLSGADEEEEAEGADDEAEGADDEEEGGEARGGDDASGSGDAAMEEDDEEEQQQQRAQDGGAGGGLTVQQQVAVPSPAMFTPGVAAAVAAAAAGGGGWLGPDGDDDDPMQQDVGAARELWGSGGSGHPQRLLMRAGRQQQQQDDSPLVFRPTPPGGGRK